MEINVVVGLGLGWISVAIVAYIVYKFIRHIFFFKPL